MANVNWVDVKADWGAFGDNIHDDTVSIKSAVNAVYNANGGIVWFPQGDYKITSAITLPVTTDRSIVLRGAGMRSSCLRPSGSINTAIIFGAITPDLSGTTTNRMSYCGIEDLSVNGSAVTLGTVCGVQMTETQDCWMRNSIIEELPNASIGMYLLGSKTTILGAPSGPVVTHSLFENVKAVTCQRPLVVQNAEECTFVNCTFEVRAGVSAATDSLFAAEFRQGHNMRFFGCAFQGDITSNKTAYVGAYIRAPINSDGSAAGDNTSHQFYGAVFEGFDRCVWQESGNNVGTMVLNPNFSIYNTAYVDGATQSGTAALQIVAPYHKTDYRDYAVSTSPAVTFSTGSTIPDVSGSNTFACGNASKTTITNFSKGTGGQSIVVRLDANTIILSGASIKCPGGTNIIGAANKVARFTNINGTTWYTETVSQD